MLIIDSAVELRRPRLFSPCGLLCHIHLIDLYVDDPMFVSRLCVSFLWVC